MTGPWVRMEGDLEEDAIQQNGPMGLIQNFTARANGGHGGKSAASMRMVNVTQKKNCLIILYNCIWLNVMKIL